MIATLAWVATTLAAWLRASLPAEPASWPEASSAQQRVFVLRTRIACGDY